MAKTIRASDTQARAMAERTKDAYSADRYASWAQVARVLFREGLNEREVEAVMRSKWTRWAADQDGSRYGRVPAVAVTRYLNRAFRETGLKGLQAELDELVAGTFRSDLQEATEAIQREHPEWGTAKEIARLEASMASVRRSR